MCGSVHGKMERMEWISKLRDGSYTQTNITHFAPNITMLNTLFSVNFACSRRVTEGGVKAAGVVVLGLPPP